VTVPGLDTLLADDGVRGRRVFVRADLNVPISDGVVGDDTRIRASLPTLRRLLAGGARVVLASHLGRPKGDRKPELSLEPVAARLAEHLGRKVAFASDCIGAPAEAAVAALGDGEIVLLENVRFHAGETAGDEGFASALAALADDYVNDAFGTAHRAHASTAGIASRVERVAAGELLQGELLSVLEALAPHADVLAIGGAMAYTFLAARGEGVGASLVEPDRFDDARRVEQAARTGGCELLLPTDHVIVERLAPDAPSRVATSVPDRWMGVDIGPSTAQRYARAAASAATIFWNGPMGVFEMDAFAKGTEAVAEAVAASDAVSVVGGGDSLAAVNKLGVGDRISHLSTGGGAALEYVQGLELPGVAALDR
jgi:phosphoglycerate kinase